MSNTLASGQRLDIGQRLVSDNGKVLLTVQSDGNLVLYRSWDRRPLWSSRTAHQSATYLMMQDDGNLVLYGNDGHAYWASNSRCPGARCVLQDDGDVAVYAPANYMVWRLATDQDWDAVDITNVHIQPHVYFVKNAATRFHLCSQGKLVHARLPSGTPAEKWVRRERGEGRFTLYNLATAARLDSDDDGRVYTSPRDNDGKYQQWAFEGEKGPVVVRNAQTQRVLDHEADVIRAERPNGATSQNWELAETSADKSPGDSFKQVVRSLFQESCTASGDREYRFSEPPRGVDLVTVDSTGRTASVKTTINYLDDSSDFRAELSDLFRSGRNDTTIRKVIVSSEGFAPQIRDRLVKFGVQPLTHAELAREMLSSAPAHDRR